MLYSNDIMQDLNLIVSRAIYSGIENVQDDVINPASLLLTTSPLPHIPRSPSPPAPSHLTPFTPTSIPADNRNQTHCLPPAAARIRSRTDASRCKPSALPRRKKGVPRRHFGGRGTRWRDVNARWKELDPWRLSGALFVSRVSGRVFGFVCGAGLGMVGFGEWAWE